MFGAPKFKLDARLASEESKSPVITFGVEPVFAVLLAGWSTSPNRLAPPEVAPPVAAWPKKLLNAFSEPKAGTAEPTIPGAADWLKGEAAVLEKIGAPLPAAFSIFSNGFP